jgi:VirE-like protein
MAQSPLDAQISVFHGSTNTTPVETHPLATVLERIRTGRYRPYVEQLRRTRTTQGDDAYARAKRRSIAFTPAGTFSARTSASLDTPSGCLNLDLDDLSDLDHARATIGADPHLVYMFVSPSDIGLKLGIWVSGFINADTYRHAWLAVERYLVQTYPDLAVNNDRACKDVSRLCYVSWDPDLYCNHDAIPFEVPPPPPPPPKPAPHTTRRPLSDDRQQRYAEQSIATAIKILDASVDGIRDQQRLKASRLLGGYIAGGVLSAADAKAGIAAAVERNTTKLQRAWLVIERGLQYGEAAPITLEHLEAEYAQWRETYTTRHPRPTPEAPAPADQPPTPAPGPAIVHHVVPDYLLKHPDPRVREHWKRIYRKTAILKERYAREGGLLCQ